VKDLIGSYKQTETIVRPRSAHCLFDSAASVWLWLVVRLYAGYGWLEVGLHKLADLAWKVAGYQGRVILPPLGTPWQAGVVAERHHGSAAATPARG
jgi:uncharacterized membrane protein YphA (DoxX/SURF4 family)